MSCRYDFHLPYLKSVLQSPIEVGTMKAFVFPLKSECYSLVKPGEGCYIHVSVLFWRYNLFTSRFCSTPVKLSREIGFFFLSWCLFFLWNVHLGCDLAKCCFCPSWFFLVTPSVICLFCQHIHDSTHTFIHTSCIVKFSKSLLIHIH